MDSYESISLKWEPVKNWMISDLMDEIVERVKVWSDNLGETKPLFMKGEAEKAIYYIPRWPLFIHLVASIIQMGASGAFHLFQCMNAKTMDDLFKVDLIGIGVMISGSAVAPIYYTYMCDNSF